MLGAAVVVLLLLWLLRGGQQQDNQIVGVQSAMNEPIAVPAAAPPPAPLPPPDPFGDRAVDLTPKGPIPEAAPEASQPAPAEAAPAPASPVPVGERAMHAWFCTAGSKLTAASRKALEGELEQFSAAFAGKELIVRGYADTRGTSTYNSALGGQRAMVVADFLRTKGLNVVDTAGVGELSGLDDNQNCANQRRVDVFVRGGPGETPSRACTPEPDVEDLVCG
jgi:outer membrane protein OmpA-like peptidoglycan-associated protein